MGLQTYRRLVKVVSANDLASQQTRRYEGQGARGSMAFLLLRSPQSRTLSIHDTAALCLAVHHGASVHEIHTARRLLTERRHTDGEMSLLEQQMIDRVRIMKGKPQIFSTQFRVVNGKRETI